MDEHRVQRVSQAVREELAELIGFELADPRVGAADVTDVFVSPDSRHARVKVAVSGTEREQREAIAALDHARHYLRHELARRLSLRRVPELHFEIDRHVDADNRIEFLLKRAKKSRGRNENQP
jgi:ribosome-binding factor A